ncbi:hypothetical protein RA178_06295 [Shewanella oncorhynchi]|uniref:Uncharacterized protein n=1 Tax=Shewanella oncorhynchi TaxID=2726434 RepID=A0AA50KGL6_9GAMM|nr:hypothetical protein [Shewanella oncorhynchi]WMB74222.1 hypothetical protein RA178_06295 [Shewanella oncorhynchi]
MKNLLLKNYKKDKVKFTTLPEEIYIRELSYRGYLEVMRANTPADKFVAAIIFGVCNEDGSLCFTSDDCDEISNSMPFETIIEVGNAILDLSNKGFDTVK